jgi:hypothetical protein
VSVYASHFQFYVRDSEPDGDCGTPHFWSPQAMADHLAVDGDIMAVGTASYGTVRVRAEVHDAAPPIEGEWDHITEAGISVHSGVLRVEGCIDTTGVDYKVAPGPYRVRCCHANRSAGVDVGDGGDWYLIQAWPGQGPERRVLKRWQADSAERQGQKGTS